MIRVKTIETENDNKCENCNKIGVDQEIKIGKSVIELCNKCTNELKWQLS